MPASKTRGVPHQPPSWTHGALALLAIFTLFGIGVLGAMVLVMKRNHAYARSVVVASQHPELQEMLGTPMRAGFFVTGTVYSKGGKGSADLSYSIKGSRHAGKVKVHATQRSGKWKVRSVVVNVPDFGKQVEVVRLASDREAAAARKWNDKAWKAFERGDFTTAEQHLAETLRIDPKNAYAYHLRGAIKHNTGLKTQDVDLLVSAEEDYLRSQELNPDSANLRRDLGKLQSQLDRMGVE